MYPAWENADAKRRVDLAKQALEISRDCADTYVVLAQHTSGITEATNLNGLGVEAGMRAIGPKAFSSSSVPV